MQQRDVVLYIPCAHALFLPLQLFLLPCRGYTPVLDFAMFTAATPARTRACNLVGRAPLEQPCERFEGAVVAKCRGWVRGWRPRPGVKMRARTGWSNHQRRQATISLSDNLALKSAQLTRKQHETTCFIAVERLVREPSGAHRGSKGLSQ